MGIVHSGIPTWVVDFAKSKLDIQVAFETGTHVGSSTKILASSFTEVYTVESNQALMQVAKSRLVDFTNIQFVLDNSPNALGFYLGKIEKPILFWLDAHYSGGDTDGLQSPCPLLEELKCVAQFSQISRSVICIDDARLFGAPHDLAPNMLGWPNLFTVLNACNDLGLRTFILDDIIVGISKEISSHFFEFLKSYQLEPLLQPNPSKKSSSVKWMFSKLWPFSN